MQFLFLAKRDKKHVVVLGAMESKSNYSERKLITDAIQELTNLNDDHKFKIINYAYENRMHYDLYIQDFSNYFALKNNLIKNGYKGLPSGLQPLFFLNNQPIMDLPKPTTKTMIQKNSKKS